MVVEVITFKKISDSLRVNLGIGFIKAIHQLVYWWFNQLGQSGVKMLASSISCRNSVDLLVEFVLPSYWQYQGKVQKYVIYERKYIYIYIVDMRNIITVMAVLIAIQIMSWKETCNSNRYCDTYTSLTLGKWYYFYYLGICFHALHRMWCNVEYVQ